MTTYRRPFDRGGLRTEIAGLFLLIWLIGVCHYAWGLEVSPADKQAYFDALAATETATQEKISTKLLAIVPDWDPVNHERLRGGEIVWEGLPGQSRLLVGAFMSRATYQRLLRPIPERPGISSDQKPLGNRGPGD